MNKLLIPNSVQIPNFIIDFIAPNLLPAEKDVLYYIYRRTLGFQKESDKISLLQFEKGLFKKDGARLDFGTGNSNPSNTKALKNLERLGLVFIVKTKSGNVYRPIMNIDIDFVLNKFFEVTKNKKIKKYFNQLKLDL